MYAVVCPTYLSFRVIGYSELRHSNFPPGVKFTEALIQINRMYGLIYNGCAIL